MSYSAKILCLLDPREQWFVVETVLITRLRDGARGKPILPDLSTISRISPALHDAPSGARSLLATPDPQSDSAL